MREIKFRCWDKQTKKMMHYESNSDIPNMTLNGVCINYNGSNNYNVSDRYKLMQYTGIKDKNGKEIYEGDIVQRFPTSSYPYYWEVKFSVDQGWDLTESADYGIIGNIYENPELLKGGVK